MRVSRILAPAAALMLALSVEARAMPADVSTGGQLLEAPAVFALAAAQAQATQPPPKADVDVSVTTERTTWYLDPVWIIVGLVALAIVIALIVAASRSGGTTVVR